MEKPIVLVIMDGVGKGDGGSGDAVVVAKTPTLDKLLATCPHTYLKAHGTAVGLPSDEDMGNSEVGHNALGCGQVYSQGAKLVGESIENGALFASATWKDLVANAEGKALHFLGLLSDGNVHSNIHHLIALLKQAKAEGVKKAYCHILLDGRDVPATSAPEYVAMLEDVLKELNTDGCDYAIGRFTRGCPNRCPWCVVPKMDGNEVRHVADLKDFWDGQKVVRLLDDNIMADADEFIRDCGQLSRAGVHVIWEALDIRLVTDETAQALASVRTEKSIHFAWDGHGQDDAVPRGIETLERNGIKPWRLMFYVLVGFNTDREYDLHRIYTLRDMGANPFVMPFDKSDRYQKDLARWCNNKFIFKSTRRFEDYNDRVR